MAIIGSAYVTIRALTDKLESDIDRALAPAIQSAGDRAGRDLGSRVQAGLDNISIAAPEIDMSGVDSSIEKSLNVGRDVTVDVDADTSKARREIEGLGDSGGRAGGNAQKNFIERFGDGNISSVLTRLFYQILWGVPVVGALIGALSSLASGLFSLASAVGPAVNALAILPGILASAVSAIGALGLAFGGVGKAFSAGNTAMAGAGKAAKAAGGAAARSANQLADAQERAAERIAEANERAAERMATLNESLVAARENLADIYEKTSRNIAKAERELVSSQNDLVKAQSKVLSAQNAVNAAREKAADAIIELQFSVEGAAISEGKAAIALERAREKLAEVSELPPNHRLRREAELQYRQAALDLEEAKKRNQDLAKEQAASAEAGIEGSKEVLKAKEDQAKAEESLTDAQQDQIDAAQELVDVQKKGSKDIAKAKKEILDIEKDLVKTEQDRKKAIADANKDLARSLRDVGLAAGAGGGGAAGGINAFNQAMKNLSPEAQAFVKYLLSIQDEFKKLRAEAGKELFPKLTTALQTLVSGGLLTLLGTGLRQIGSVIGDVAIKIGNLSKDPFFQKSFAAGMESSAKVTASFGDSLVSMIDLFNTLVDAASPLTESFAEWIAQISGNWASSARENFDGLREAILAGGEIVKQVGRIFGNLWDAIKLVGEAARPAGQSLLDSFEGATEKLNEFLGAPGRGDALKTYFFDVAENVRKLGELTAVVALEFFKLGDNPAIGQIADTLRTQVVPALGEMIDSVTSAVGPQIAEVFASLVGVFDQLATSGGLQAFMDVIQGVADGLLALTQIPGFSTFLGLFASFVGTYKALSFLGKITGVGMLVTDMKALGGAVTGTGSLGGFVRDMKALQAQSAAAGGSMSAFAAAQSVVGMRMDVVKGKMGGLSKGFGVIGKSIKDHPILWLAGALISLVAAFAATEKGQEVFKKLGDSIMGVLGTIGDALGPVFEQLQPAIEELGRAFTPLLEVLGGAFADILTTLAPPLGELAAVLGGALLQIVMALMPLISELAGVFVSLLPAFMPLVSAVVSLASAFIPLIIPIANLVVSLLPPLISLIVAVIEPVAGLAVKLVEFLVPGIEMLSAGIQVVAGWITDFIGWLTGLVGGVGDAIDEVGGLGAVFEAMGDVLGRVWEGIKGGASAVWDWIVGAISGAISAITDIFFKWHPLGIIIKNWDAIVKFLGDTWNKIITGLKASITVIGTVLGGWVQSILAIPGKIAAGLATLWNALWNGLQAAVALAMSFLSGLLNYVLALPGKVLSALATLWNILFTGAQVAVAKALAFLLGLWNYIAALPGNFGKMLGSLWNSIWSTIQGAINTARTYLEGLITFVAGIPGRIGRAVGNMWSALQTGVVAVKDWIAGRWNEMVANVAGLPGRIGSAAGGMWDGIKNAFRSAINWIIDKWNGLSFKLPTFEAFGQKIGGTTISVPNIPRFAKGGIVSSTPGGIFANIGEGGNDERITPLDSKGRSASERELLAEFQNMQSQNITINIYAQPGQDVNALAQEVSRRLAFGM